MSRGLLIEIFRFSCIFSSKAKTKAGWRRQIIMMFIQPHIRFSLTNFFGLFDLPWPCSAQMNSSWCLWVRFESCQQHRTINKNYWFISCSFWRIMKNQSFFLPSSWEWEKFLNNKARLERKRRKSERKRRQKVWKMPKVFEFAFLINFISYKLDLKSLPSWRNSNFARPPCSIPSSRRLLPHSTLQQMFFNLLRKHFAFAPRRLMFALTLIRNHIKSTFHISSEHQILNYE